jgi:L-fuconolactonase
VGTAAGVDLLVIDAQLHEPPVTRDWAGADEPTRRDLLDELQLAMMAAVGVDRAVLFPTELEWALQAADRYPDRFRVVPMFTAGGGFGLPSADGPDVEAEIARLAKAGGVAGFRIVRTVPDGRGGHMLAPPEVFDRMAAACAGVGLPVFMSTVGDLATPGVLAARHPEIAVIVDHLGLPQPPSYQRESPPFRSLPALLALAVHPNLAVKCSGAPTLSTQAYPFADLWPHLHAVIDAFGPERVMWGSDYSRLLGRAGFRFRIPGGESDYQGKHTYAQALHYIAESPELDGEQRAWILGRTAQRLLRWP